MARKENISTGRRHGRPPRGDRPHRSVTHIDKRLPGIGKLDLQKARQKVS